MTKTQPESGIFCLHDSFTTKGCTFLSGEKGVIYSPLNSETLLCDPSIIRFLAQLESNPDSELILQEFYDTHPGHAGEIIDKLKSMMIIKIKV